MRENERQGAPRLTLLGPVLRRACTLRSRHFFLDTYGTGVTRIKDHHFEWCGVRTLKNQGLHTPVLKFSGPQKTGACTLNVRLQFST